VRVKFGNRCATEAKICCSVVPVRIMAAMAVVTGVVSSMVSSSAPLRETREALG
jgi:hypothetical protein